MLVIKIDKSLSEVKPMLVSSCMKLLGREIPVQTIEDCLQKDRLSGLTLNEVTDIVNYSNVVDFLQGCKIQNYRIMSSTLAITLCNFLLRKISLTESFVRSDINLNKLQADLDTIFQKAHRAENTNEALKVVMAMLPPTRFIVSDLEAFVFVVLNFYMYNYKQSVVLFDDSSTYDYGDIKNLYFAQLSDWVSEL